MIRIDLGDERPLEDQIATGLRNAMAQGSVAAGQELPSARQLASDLGVHWNTVARAYRRLADEGLVTVRRGRGAVAAAGRRSRQRLSRVALRSRLLDVVAVALLGGLSREEVVTAFEEALASFSERERS